MGSIFSKSSPSSGANTAGQKETTLQHLNNSIRRSFRSKKSTGHVAEDSGAKIETSPTEPQKARSPARPEPPKGVQQPSTGFASSQAASKETTQASERVAPIVAATEVAQKVSPTAAAPHTVKHDASSVKEINKTAELPQKASLIAEAPKTGAEGISAVNETSETKKVPEKAMHIGETSEDADTSKETRSALYLLKEAHASRPRQAEGENKKEETELHHVENILFKLAPKNTSDELSPEEENNPKPTVSLLAALEKRKAKKAEKEEEVEEDKEGDSDTPKPTSTSPGVTNVLETIAVGSSAIKSKEAAHMMATFTFEPPSPKEAETAAEEKRGDSVDAE